MSLWLSFRMQIVQIHEEKQIIMKPIKVWFDQI